MTAMHDVVFLLDVDNTRLDIELNEFGIEKAEVDNFLLLRRKTVLSVNKKEIHSL